ncbi:MAG: DUF72 domain-containing protein [Pseudomonadales bacterium]
MSPRLRIGLPAWAFSGWRGRYFEDTPSPLASYARVFNAVEGNTTFYRIPDRNTVSQWQRATDGRPFEFCFKLPRAVTHDARPDLGELAAFLDAVGPLGDRLGPLLLQFPAAVGPEELGRFECVFSTVCDRHRAVLEVRHDAFYSDPDRIEPLLERFRLGRVVLDTRALYAGDPDHPDVRAARHEKPDLPVQPQARSGLVFVRLVLHPDFSGNDERLREWAERAAGYLADDQRVYLMVHCPNNLYCPDLAATLHGHLRARVPDLEPLPSWPVPQQARLI